MTKRKDKKKKSLARRILKWTGISLLLIIALLILIPIIFKDEIKEMAVKEANKMLLADVAVGDFDLTLLSTFPTLTISFDDVSITGREKFEGIKLVDVKNLNASVGLWSVIGGEQIEVNAIHLTEPKIDVRVLQNGVANYDIVKPDSVLVEEENTESSNFKLQLQEYSIKNGTVKYDDAAGELYAEIVNLNHTGKGDLTADVIDFETKTTADELTFEMAGMSYLTKVKSDFLINLLMEFNENSSKFTLKENTLALNNFKVNIDGYYEMLKDHDMLDFKLNAEKTSFKDLLSLIPSFYTMGYEKMATAGTLSLNASSKGRLDETNMPAWDAMLKVAGASITYPDVPGKIANININAGSKFPGGNNLDEMTIDMEKFHAEFVGNEIDATLLMRNPITDPYIKAGLIANVDLATLKQVMPMAEGESYNGKLRSDINVDGKMSSLEKEDYEAFKADGKLQIDAMNYASADLPSDVKIETMKFLFSPSNLKLENFDAKMGASDFNANGTISNYMGYIFKDENLKGNFMYASNTLNLDELIPTSSEASTENTETSTSSETTDPLLIPANIDFTLNSKINTLIYDGLEIKNIDGLVNIKDEQAELSNLKMAAMGGDIKMNGKYDTRNHATPKVAFGYDLAKIDINQLTKNFVTIEKLAPVAKYTQGLLDSKFTMSADLMPDFSPVYNSINGVGDLFTNDVQIAGFKPIEKLAEVMKIANIQNGTFKDVKAKFTLIDGKLLVKPFDLDFGKGLKSVVSGTTSLEQDIDYKMAFNVPKALIPASFIAVAEKATAQINKIPGFKMDGIPDNINVNAFITNKVTDPKISTNFKEALMAQAGGVKDAIKDVISDKVNQAKDSVQTIVNNTIDDVKEDFTAKKKEIMDQAQQQANNVKAEAKKAADKVRSEAQTQANNLMNEAGNNPLKKKAAEIAGKKLIEKAEKNAQKIENEGNNKADKIMTVAQEKADNLGK